MQLVLLFLSLLLLGQHQVVYEKKRSLSQVDTGVADYVGTWTGRVDDKDFKVVLKERKDFRMANGKFYDVLIGGHSYMSSVGSVKNESLSNFENNQKGLPIFGMIDPENKGQIFIIFSDNTNHKTLHVTLSFVAGSRNKIRWLVTKEIETIGMVLGVKPVKGVSVPTNIVLKRIK